MLRNLRDSAVMTLAGKRIGLLTESASRLGGGVFEAVVQQAALIAAAGGTPYVVAPSDAWSAVDRERFATVQVAHVDTRGPALLRFAPGLRATLLAADLDLLHLHGIWVHPSHAGERWAAATGRPYVISPHGMLDPWITGRGRWKKALARRGYERRSWARATLLHGLTADEAADIARESGRSDAVVIPNAAPLAIASTSPRAGILYLGRLHAKKNLAALIAAWGSVPHGEAILTIAGMGAADDVAAVEAAVARTPGVRFVGPVQGAAKAALLATARWLVLPSLSEGLPMVVLEAWAAGTPTIMTPACHLPEGFDAGAALACGDGVDAVAAALTAAFATPLPEWERRSAAALTLATGSFSLSTVAARWTALYAALMA